MYLIKSLWWYLLFLIEIQDLELSPFYFFVIFESLKQLFPEIYLNFVKMWFSDTLEMVSIILRLHSLLLR